MAPVVTRVGIVVKPGLTGATDVVQEIAAWLQARGVEPWFEPDAGALAGPAASGHTHSHDEIASSKVGCLGRRGRAPRLARRLSVCLSSCVG